MNDNDNEEEQEQEQELHEDEDEDEDEEEDAEEDERFSTILGIVQNNLLQDTLTSSQYKDILLLCNDLDALKDDIRSKKHLYYKIPRLNKKYRKTIKRKRGGNVKIPLNIEKLLIRIVLCVIIAGFGTLYLDKTFHSEIDFLNTVGIEISSIQSVFGIKPLLLERIFTYISENEKMKIILETILNEIKKTKYQDKFLMELLIKCDIIKVLNVTGFAFGFFSKFNSTVDLIHDTIFNRTQNSLILLPPSISKNTHIPLRNKIVRSKTIKIKKPLRTLYSMQRRSKRTNSLDTFTSP